MKLRLFVPNADALGPAPRLAWMLFDARDRLQREGRDAPAAIPRAERVEAVLPAERVLFARLQLPQVNAGTLAELLPFAVEDRLLADPAHVHAVAGPRNARGETVVAVVDRDWLAGMVAALAREGLAPQRAFSEAALLAGGRDDWNVVLGPGRGLLVDDEGVSATFDRGESFPLALRLALDEAAARGTRPKSVRVHLEGGEAPPDFARWSAEGGVPFSAGTQWEVLARGHPAAGSHNLLVGAMAPASRTRVRLPRAAAGLAAAIALLQVGFLAADAWRLERERTALEARREAVFRAAFPEAKVVVDPELQMARNLADLRRSRGEAAGDDFLAQLSRAAAGGARRASVVEYRDGRLQAR